MDNDPYMEEEMFTKLTEGKGLDSFEMYMLKLHMEVPAEKPEHFPDGQSELSQEIIQGILVKALAKIDKKPSVSTPQ